MTLVGWHRKTDAHEQAAVLAIGQFKLRAMQFGDAGDDGQAQPAALGFLSGQAIEAVENRCPFVCRDAGAGIGHGQRMFSAPHIDPHIDSTTRRCVVDGIVDQVA